MHKLFVDGILKPSHSDIVARNGGESLGLAVTTDPAFDLYHLGGFPGMTLGDFQIRGEVVAVPDLAPYDRIEGHPTFYKRTPISVVGAKGERFSGVEAYIYQGSPSFEAMPPGVDGTKIWTRTSRWM